MRKDDSNIYDLISAMQDRLLETSATQLITAKEASENMMPLLTERINSLIKDEYISSVKCGENALPALINALQASYPYLDKPQQELASKMIQGQQSPNKEKLTLATKLQIISMVLSALFNFTSSINQQATQRKYEELIEAENNRIEILVDLRDAVIELTEDLPQGFHETNEVLLEVLNSISKNHDIDNHTDNGQG